jgi:phage baseplate assembly protein gpV
VPIRPENKDRYPADWPEISRRIREDRAGGRCECEGECGRPHKGRCERVNGDELESGWVCVLTTAHLDHTPENCADENLKAMCQGCHLHYDREHHAQTAYNTRREGKVIADLFVSEVDNGS